MALPSKIGSWALAAPLAAVVLAGCQTVGPTSIARGRPDYNEAIHATSTDMNLANIVRIRHGEMPLVMDVTQVNAGVILQTSLAPNVAGIGGLSALQGAGRAITTGTTAGGSTGALSSQVVGSQTEGVGLSMGYQENPTVTYTPLAGQALISQLATPFPLSTLSALLNQQWGVSPLLSFTLSSITPSGVDNMCAMNGLFELYSYNSIYMSSLYIDPTDYIGDDSDATEEQPEKKKPSLFGFVLGQRSPPAATPSSVQKSAGIMKAPSGEQDNALAIYFTPRHPFVPPEFADSMFPYRAEAGAAYPDKAYTVRRRSLNLWVGLLEIYAAYTPMRMSKYNYISMADADLSRSASGLPKARLDLKSREISFNGGDFYGALLSVEDDIIACEREDDKRKADTGCIDKITGQIPGVIVLHNDAYIYRDVNLASKVGVMVPTITAYSAVGMLQAATGLPEISVSGSRRPASSGYGEIAFLSKEDYQKFLNVKSMTILKDLSAKNASGELAPPGVSEFYEFSKEELDGTAEHWPRRAGLYNADQYDLVANGTNLLKRARVESPDAQDNEVNLSDDRHFIIVVVTHNPPSEDLPGDKAYATYRYHGDWYSIMQSDTVSKRNFSLVSLLMSVMAISSQTPPPTPSISVSR
jgi:hypothetical protein